MLALSVLFIVMPVVELYFIIKVGSFIGALNTIILIIFTGILGAYLAKREGIQVIKNINLSLSKGELPAYHLIEGFVILIAGFLLITPGFITDSIGFLLLIPPTRLAFIKAFINYLNRKIEKGDVKIFISF